MEKRFLIIPGAPESGLDRVYTMRPTDERGTLLARGIPYTLVRRPWTLRRAGIIMLAAGTPKRPAPKGVRGLLGVRDCPPLTDSDALAKIFGRYAAAAATLEEQADIQAMGQPGRRVHTMVADEFGTVDVEHVTEISSDGQSALTMLAIAVGGPKSLRQPIAEVNLLAAGRLPDEIADTTADGEPSAIRRMAELAYVLSELVLPPPDPAPADLTAV